MRPANLTMIKNNLSHAYLNKLREDLKNVWKRASLAKQTKVPSILLKLPLGHAFGSPVPSGQYFPMGQMFASSPWLGVGDVAFPLQKYPAWHNLFVEFIPVRKAKLKFSGEKLS